MNTENCCVANYSDKARSGNGTTGSIYEDARNETLYKLACSLRAEGSSENNIVLALMEENQARCCPPLSENEIEEIARQTDNSSSNDSGEQAQTWPLATQELIALLDTFEPGKEEAPDLIGGLFPRGYPSILVGEAGIGKSILIQRLMCDLSVGGPVFDGFATTEPMALLLLCGEAGLRRMNYRLDRAGWQYDPAKITICDSRRVWQSWGDIDLSTDKGRDALRAMTEEKKPDLVIIDSLGSFIDNESDRKAMKKFMDFLMRLTDQNRCAALLVHHTRKRKNSERNMSLNLDDVFGSNTLGRQVALIVGMERRLPAGNTRLRGSRDEILVRHLKTWDEAFPPFSFTIQDEDDGEHMSVSFNLNPPVDEGKRAQVWSVIMGHCGDGSEFQRSNIVRLCDGISEPYIKRLLGDWVKHGRLERGGSNRDTVYRLTTHLVRKRDETVSVSRRTFASTESEPGTTEEPSVTCEIEDSSPSSSDIVKPDSESQADVLAEAECGFAAPSNPYTPDNTASTPAAVQTSGVPSGELSDLSFDCDFSELDIQYRVNATAVSGGNLAKLKTRPSLDTGSDDWY